MDEHEVDNQFYVFPGVRVNLTSEQLARRQKIVAIWRRVYSVSDSEQLAASPQDWQFLEELISHKDN